MEQVFGDNISLVIQKGGDRSTAISFYAN